MVETFYFDTYALVEISLSNPKYSPYKDNIKVILNKLNLFELCYYFKRKGMIQRSKEIFQEYSKYNVDYDDEILMKAAEMKLKYLKKRISFVDCIGYLLAKKNNAKFLTGDEHFRNMDNVEFVK